MNKLLKIVMFIQIPIWILAVINYTYNDPQRGLQLIEVLGFFLAFFIVVIKYPNEIFGFIGRFIPDCIKFSPNKVIAYVIGGILYGILFLIMMTPILLIFFMYCRLLGFIMEAILKCFWIIK